MTLTSRRTFVSTLVAGCATPWVPAWAQTPSGPWPNRPVRLLVPFNAGGPADIVARQLSAPLSAALGQPVVVENKGGAATIIGWDTLVKAPADGYTFLLAGVGGRAILPSVAKLPYDPEKDTRGVTRLANSPNVFVVRASLGVKTLQELVAKAKSQSTPLNLGLAAPGTLTHFASSLLQRDAGIQLMDVAYRGGAPTVNALLSGEVDLMTADLGAVLPHIQSGKVLALAVADSRRAPQLPDVPTVKEAGLPALEAVNIWGIYAHSGVPTPIIQRLSTQVATLLKKPELQEAFARLGMQAEASTPEAFDALTKAQTAYWSPVAKASGVRVN